MKKLRSLGILMVAVLLATLAASPAYAGNHEEQRNGQEIPGRYIVLLTAGGDTADKAGKVGKKHGLAVDLVYTSIHGAALKGAPGKLKDLQEDTDVRSAEPDRVVSLGPPGKQGKAGGGGSEQPPQTLPTGVNRIDADLSTTANINGSDERVNVDIAIIDTGIAKHPDLNLFKHVFCTGTGSNTDKNGHGTHVAGTAAALDNSIGVVGVAPGARLWGVKVLNDSGSGFLSCVIAGVDYVTNNAASIEVANMSLGCECSSPGLDNAISTSVAAGVTYVVAAGNSSKDAGTFSPANHPDVIALSAIADFNGVGGGGAEATCRPDVDDTFADFSNFGSVVDIAAPGVCILSTWTGSGYNTISGTSMATPHVTGAAALYKANNPGASPAAVKDALIAAGKAQTDPTYGFTGDPDTFPEPLVYAGNL